MNGIKVPVSEKKPRPKTVGRAGLLSQAALSFSAIKGNGALLYFVRSVPEAPRSRIERQSPRVFPFHFVAFPRHCYRLGSGERFKSHRT